MRASTLFTAAFAPLMTYAVSAPSVDGMTVTWQDKFNGCQGCSPSTKSWNTITDLAVNSEMQTYTTSNKNIQLSGGHTLQLIPWRNDSGSWTSGRLETTGSYMAEAGKKLRIQGSLRIGEGASKKGIWPAFWTLGDSMRHGTEWPRCGEIDIYEQINGIMNNHGTIHCGSESGGPCNEPEGMGGTTEIPDNDFHTWSLVIDRSSNDWSTEYIAWLKDGEEFFRVTGSQIGDEATWGTLAHSPLYVILNVAVGGSWPGDPTSSTDDGYDSMMEVEYVAVYNS